MSSLAEEIIKLLKEIRDELKKMNQPFFVDEKTKKILEEYEKRYLAEFVLRNGLPPRLPNECPKCYEKGKITKGILTDVKEFKKSVIYYYKCPVCGHEWVAQIKRKK